jgi:hypothetical protein
MAEGITKDGITISTSQEIADRIINGSETTEGLKAIFGEDTNFDQDSPDAQLVNIFAQCVRDFEEKLVEVFNSFDPDQASGSVLDARVLYNGVIRKGGRYAQLEITVVTNRDLTLTGIDGRLTDEEIQAANVFTVQDYIGNQYYLMNTQNLSAGNNAGKRFRARYMGPVTCTPNSVNQIVTPIRGVLSVNNPKQPDIQGVAQETDDELKLRRARAVNLGMLGGIEIMEASLRQITDVVDARVFENRDNFPTEDGIPAHGIWAIVRGGDVNKIADCIFLTLSEGCDMKGSTEIPVRTAFDYYFNVRFDVAEKEPLSIRLHAEPINGVDVMDPNVLADYIANNYDFMIYEAATITEIDKRCRDFNSQFSYSQIEISAEENSRGEAFTTVTFDSQRISNFASTGNGSLNITLNGEDTVQVNGINFAGVTTVVDIANRINLAFDNAGVGAIAEGTDTEIKIISKKRGTGSSVTVNALEGAAPDDLSGSGFLDAEGMTYTEGIAATAGFIQSNELNETRLLALRAITNGSFGISVNGSNPIQINNLNFSDCNTAESVTSVVQAGLRANQINATATTEGLLFKIASNSYGTSSTILITNGTDGTNVRTAELLISPDTSPVAGTNGTNGTAVTDTLDYLPFKQVYNGALAISVNGSNGQVISELDFHQVTSVEEIANIINLALVDAAIPATASYNSGAIVFTSNIPGEGSTIEFVPYVGAFTDISNATYLSRVSMDDTHVGQSPLNWYTMLFPAYKKNYFSIDADYITITIDE